METISYIIHEPSVKAIPIIISCPHTGTEIPDEIALHMTDEAKQTPDTDWFVHNLYAFAPAMGITLIRAKYSRYVIDLNRNPEGKRLYSDQRAETSLVPTSTFSLQPIYNEDLPSKTEIDRRYNLYYRPYHQKLTSIIQSFKGKWKNVLLFDAHSIKRHVPSIRLTPFPDIVVSDQLGKTAHPRLVSSTLSALSALQVAYNDPFMGGHITRTFGQPDSGVHALQLEMSQDLYMNEILTKRDADKERRVQLILQQLLQQLAKTLEDLR